MNRREALQAGISVLAAAGIDGEVATVSPVNPQAIVIRTDLALREETMAKVREHFKTVLAGTKLAGLPVIILTQGATLEIIDAPAEKTP